MVGVTEIFQLLTKDPFSNIVIPEGEKARTTVVTCWLIAIEDCPI
jgi:hypothetical protein